MDKDGFEISRRKVLAGIGGVGAASAGAGMGTSAFFSDTEEFENNTLTAGTLDLKAGFQSHYSVWSENEAAAGTGSAFLDATLHDAAPGLDFSAGAANTCTGDALGNALDRPVVVLEDVKPGDFGLIAFELRLCGSPANPGFVWVNARQNLSLGANAENGVGEAEGSDDDEIEAIGTTGTALSGELGAELRIRPFYVGGGSTSFSSAVDGLFGSYGNDAEAFAMDFFNAFDLGNAPTLNEFLLSVASGLGIPLDGDLSNGGFGTSGNVQGGTGPDSGFVLIGDPSFETAVDTTSSRDCFAADASYIFGLAWGLDVDHANEIQTDSVAFDLGFYTEQCRHNDGNQGGFGGAEAPVETSLGTGFAKLSPTENVAGGYGTDGENFNGTGEYATAGHARQKDSSALQLRNTADDPLTGFVAHDWTPDGITVEHVVYTHDGVDTVEMSVGSDSVGPVSTANGPADPGQLAIQTKADEATVSVANVQLTVGGTPVPIKGPTGVTASNNGSGRDFRYLLLDTTVVDLTQGFRIDADVAINEQGDFPGTGPNGIDEAWAFDVYVE